MLADSVVDIRLSSLCFTSRISGGLVRQVLCGEFTATSKV
jgi:hypothetical protein